MDAGSPGELHGRGGTWTDAVCESVCVKCTSTFQEGMMAWAKGLR